MFLILYSTFRLVFLNTLVIYLVFRPTYIKILHSWCGPYLLSTTLFWLIFFIFSSNRLLLNWLIFKIRFITYFSSLSVFVTGIFPVHLSYTVCCYCGFMLVRVAGFIRRNTICRCGFPINSKISIIVQFWNHYISKY